MSPLKPPFHEIDDREVARADRLNRRSVVSRRGVTGGGCHRGIVVDDGRGADGTRQGGAGRIGQYHGEVLVALRSAWSGVIAIEIVLLCSPGAKVTEPLRPVKSALRRRAGHGVEVDRDGLGRELGGVSTKLASGLVPGPVPPPGTSLSKSNWMGVR